MNEECAGVDGEVRAYCAWLSAQIRQILRLCHAALCKCGQRTLAETDLIGFAAAKDRKSNATFGSVFDSGGLSQSPISHQEVLGAAVDQQYRPTGAACSLKSGCGKQRRGRSDIRSQWSRCTDYFTMPFPPTGWLRCIAEVQVQQLGGSDLTAAYGNSRWPSVRYGSTMPIGGLWPLWRDLHSDPYAQIPTIRTSAENRSTGRGSGRQCCA